MFLKGISANGFKSFADKTNIDIKNGITCIVGPNGSGKSNIVDAIKWVLGEQSVKNLRGKNLMSDIIFSGSKSRSEQNRAIVTLRFDNSDHYLNSDFNEIEVKRIVYKTGENEYYINNCKSRLKDITDLFIDSGASKEAFNIISQGAIADIVNSKPADRRIIFEEAAGVLKYKKRKEESLKKLEKTKDNLEKVHMLIDELSVSLKPLEEQNRIACEYLKYKEELEKIEVALIANDIKNINDKSEELKIFIDKTKEKSESMYQMYIKDNSEIEKQKLLLIKIDDEIFKLNDEIMDLEKNLSLQADKQLMVERKKYEVEDSKLEKNIINLKEAELNLKSKIDTKLTSIEVLQKELKNIDKDKKNVEESYFSKIEKNEKTSAKYNQLKRESLEISNKIDIITENIENDIKVPYAVKCCLNNPRLKGIHGTISKIIDYDEKYSSAIEIALGANNNVIVVDNEQNAKLAIEYLKMNKIGRATFFPINIIKSKYIDSNTLTKIENESGFIGIASKLVKFDKKFQNIIENQLGNIIVVSNIDSMNSIGKIVDYRYRVVTLDGDILYSGGAISGGSTRSNHSLNQKFELDSLKRKKKELDYDITKYEDEITKLTDDIQKLNLQQNELEKRYISCFEKIKNEKLVLSDYQKSYDSIKKEIDATENVKENKLDEEIDRILNKIYDYTKKKDEKDISLTKLKTEKNDINNQIFTAEQKIRSNNSEYNKCLKDMKEAEISLGKYDVKLDNLLLNLNENYNLTYESAVSNHELEMEEDLARITVNKLKNKIKMLGDVNLGAISEYDRVNTRYTFLNDQSKDLEKASSNLIEVINEMDNIMVEKFKESFKLINEEFKQVFKKLFKGGEGRLLLTDPDNMLETGIEIIAEPPGKKLGSIALLSGGEKTLTAISLLFAILNVKPVPFCVLDEVEAALDDANVEAFGKYLISKKEKSQFIIITHKKKTMEYADTLYGITMQESGVSKLVSVKLEDN